MILHQMSRQRGRRSKHLVSCFARFATMRGDRGTRDLVSRCTRPGFARLRRPPQADCGFVPGSWYNDATMIRNASLKKRILSGITGVCVWFAVSVSCSSTCLVDDKLQGDPDDYSFIRVVFGVLIPVLVGMLVGIFVYHVIASYHRWFPSGHCQECSYDLTGNESGVCPECGTQIRAGV